MGDCIFCKIVKGDIPCYKIWEDENFLAFLDISSFVDGHTLVIPKEHYRFFWNIPNVDEYYSFVSEICKHYTENLGYEYIDTMTFGRMVPHAHVHIIPHNGEQGDWKNAIKNIGDLQADERRRLTKERGEEIQRRFSLFTKER